jgi:hypothetical protein
VREPYVSDEQIAAMSPGERRRLIQRLARPADQLRPSQRAIGRRHRLRSGMLGAGMALLLPWIIYLGFTLPTQYEARHWTIVWVGFDALLAFMLAATALLVRLRRQLAVLTGFATGVLLLCDAWFDILTAQPRDALLAAVFGLLVELPVAVMLIGNAVQLVGLMAARLWLHEPGAPLWRIPLLAPVRHEPGDLFDPEQHPSQDSTHA